MISRHRRIVAGLATTLAAVGVAVGSSASFSADSANPANTFTAGTLTHTNSKDGAILTAGNLKPGDSQTGEVTITNTGTLPGTFTLKTTSVSGDLLPKLSVVITDTTNGTDVYTGALAQVGNRPLAGEFPANGGSRTYRFKVTLAQDADNSFQGKSATAAFAWAEVQ